jgi:hypothetical protein
LVKKCCCCNPDLRNGVMAWAVIDIIFHLLLLGLPFWNLSVAPWAEYLTIWICAIIVCDVLAFIGALTSRYSILSWHYLTPNKTLQIYLIVLLEVHTWEEL